MQDEIKNNGIDKHKLRFGIMCEGVIFPAWQASCLNKLIALKGVVPALLIIDSESSNSRTIDKIKSKLKETSRIFWHIYSFYIIKKRSRVMRPVNMENTFNKTSKLECKTIIKKGNAQEFTDEDIGKIKEYNLDFIIRFGFRIIKGKILNIPKFGVWSFHHGDASKYRGSPPAFWEIYFDDNVTGAILQRLTERLDAGIVLKRGYLKTTKSSYLRNINNIISNTTHWPTQVCIDIINGKAEYLAGAPLITQAQIYKAPNNIELLHFIIKETIYLFRHIYRNYFFYENWNIGIVDKSVQNLLSSNEQVNIRWQPKQRNHKFIADPFIQIKDNRKYVLFEEFNYKTYKGRIAVSELTHDFSSEKTYIIGGESHFSYPYLFNYQGEIYCVPESSGTQGSLLYKAINFPNEWILVKQIIGEFPALDNTIVRYKDYWWLFATNSNDGPNCKLNIWFAKDPLGPWVAHNGNPVKIDIRSSRPAGNPFIHEGDLYRPAQDCSEGYGGRIVINRVRRLTTTEFEETPVKMIGPDKNGKYPDGMHTISSVNNTTLVDGVRRCLIINNLPVISHRIMRCATRLAGRLFIDVVCNQRKNCQTQEETREGEKDVWLREAGTRRSRKR